MFQTVDKLRTAPEPSIGQIRIILNYESCKATLINQEKKTYMELEICIIDPL